jgi:hypothetical protein
VEVTHESSSEMHRLHQKFERIEAELERLTECADELSEMSGPAEDFDHEYAMGIRMAVKYIGEIIND